MVTMHSSSSRRVYSLLKKCAVTLGMVALFVFAGAATLTLFLYSRPLSLTTTQMVVSLAPERSPDIAWPLAQASIGTTTDGILTSKPGQKPQPTASTAKLLTALTILKAKPLRQGEQGPFITIRQQDLAIYDNYFTKDGSLASIQLGERLSQYQMLQGILIRSANNFADSLAIWAFGSLEAYQQAAQKMADELGMTQTTVGTDASGFSPTTLSTADDLTRLGIAAMKNEVIRDIVRQTSVDLPIDGVTPNTNGLLGTDGVIGIKTGTTTEAGGVFIIASEYTVAGEAPITIVSAVQGETSTADAMTEANRLVNTIKPYFTRRTIIKKGDVFATITAPWGESTAIVAAHDSTIFGWKNTSIHPKVTLSDQKPPLAENTVVGTVSVGDILTNLVTEKSIHLPSWQWRITTKR